MIREVALCVACIRTFHRSKKTCAKCKKELVTAFMHPIGRILTALAFGAAASVMFTVVPSTIEHSLTGATVDNVGGVYGPGDVIMPGSHIVMVLGPTGIPTPTDEYLATAYNNYLDPSGVYTGDPAMVFSLTTDELSGDTSGSLIQDELDIRSAVVPLLAQGDTITFFGYSQSTAALSEQLDQLEQLYPGQLDFLYVGDSASPYGMLNNIFSSLPSWLQRPLEEGLDALHLAGGILDTGPGGPPMVDLTPTDIPGEVYTLQEDGWSDWPSATNALNSDTSLGEYLRSFFGLFTNHEAYFGLNAGDFTLDPSLTEGLVDYFVAPPPDDMLQTLFDAAVGVGWL